MCVYIIVCMPVCIFVSVLDMEKSPYERRVEVGIDSVPIDSTCPASSSHGFKF